LNPSSPPRKSVRHGASASLRSSASSSNTTAGSKSPANWDADTTFNIFLPSLPNPPQFVERIDPPTVRGGHETILVVEDEGTLRALTCNALERYGYRVLEARSGTAALDVWRDHHESIDLLLTDLVMPRAFPVANLPPRASEKPHLKVIYMSGYAGDVAGKTLQLREGVNFLQKPYSPLKLAQIVRQRLDQSEP